MWKPSAKEKELTKTYLKSLPKLEDSNANNFMIGMIGLPGTGKSHIANLIAEKLNLYIYSADRIRRFLNENGYTGDNPHQGMVEYISDQTTKYLLKNKVSYIMDSDIIRFVGTLRRKAKRSNAGFILVRVVSSENTVLARIKSRRLEQNANNHSMAGEDRYHARKVLHQKLPRKIFFTFDNEKPLEPQLDKFLLKVNDETCIQC